MSKKADRQNLIKELITTKEINTQEELTSLLINRGFNVTQATVSRDINELNLVKVEGTTKKQRYATIDVNIDKISDKSINMFKATIVSMAVANNLIILKTITANAGYVGTIVDKMNLSQILGTIAGDDVLLIITKTNKEAESVLKKFKELIK